MTNFRLRNALNAAEMTPAALASAVDVDPKSVERWLTQSRQPHPTTRAKVVRVLGFEETYFWPKLLGRDAGAGVAQAELVQLWPQRNDIPDDIWRHLIHKTHSRMEILVYAGGFLVESMNLTSILRQKSADGAEVRLLFGDPTSPAVRDRAEEEGLPTLPQRCRSTLEYLAEAVHLPGVEIRTHRTPLYASQFRFDDAMLVNTHTYGSWAARSPVQHLQRMPGGQLFDYYTKTFERVWDTGRPLG